MKLYYSPGACSLSPHIVLREAGETFDLVRVDLKTHKTESGDDFHRINPKGYVPTLELDDGSVLTEGVAIVQYIADTHPDSHLAPAAGTFDRAKLQEHLNFIATEFHKAFGPLFKPDSSASDKTAAIKIIERRLTFFEGILDDGRSFLMGEHFTVADAYLFTVVKWTYSHNIDLKKWQKLATYMGLISARDSVQQALEAEGLSK